MPDTQARRSSPIPVTPAAPIKYAPDPKVKPDNVRGLVLMGLGFFMFAAADIQAKVLTETLNPLQIVWCRQFALIAGVVILIAMRGRKVLATAHPRLQLARGTLAALSATLFITGIQFIPLGEAVAISFVAPFIVTILSGLILREKVGIRRWTAVALGFLGTMVIIRPGTDAMHPAAFIIFAAAACFALRQVVSRHLSGSDRTETTVAYTAITSGILLTLPQAFVFEWPTTGKEYMLLAGLAILSAFGELLVIKALEIAQAAIVAPMQYSLMLWGTMYSYLVYNDLPDLWTWIGASIIVATGIYTLHRERVVAKRARNAAQP